MSNLVWITPLESFILFPKTDIFNFSPYIDFSPKSIPCGHEQSEPCGHEQSETNFPMIPLQTILGALKDWLLSLKMYVNANTSRTILVWFLSLSNTLSI